MADPRSLGFCPDRLAKLDRFITEKYLQPGRMPCAQVLIARHGEIVHEFVGGRRDVARDLASGADTIFRIYSMTKPITSVAFMMLVEEGKVDSTIRSIALFPNGRTSACSTLASQAVF